MDLKIGRLYICIGKNLYKCKEMLYFQDNGVSKHISAVSWTLHVLGWELIVDIEAKKDREANGTHYEPNSSSQSTRE